MTQPLAPIVCFLMGDGLHNELCLRYWSIDSSGRWTEPFNQLLTDFGLRQPAMLKLLDGACRAYAQHIRCSECGRPAELKVRGDYAPSTGKLARRDLQQRGLCASCLAIVAAAEQMATANAERTHAACVRDIVGSTAEQFGSIDYDTLSYSHVFILYCVLVAANLGWNDDKICALSAQPGDLAPTPDLSLKFYEQLYDNGVIFPDPSSDPAAFIIEDDRRGFRFLFWDVDWLIAADSRGRPFSQIVPMLVARLDRPDPQSAEVLWYQIAEGECAMYFLEQCQRYRFIKEDIYSDKIAEAIRYCLDGLSIGQVWNIIYYVMRDLAGLSQDKTYARQHVYNMIPGNIRRYADYRASNNKEIRPWSRRQPNREAWATSILLDKVIGDGNIQFENLSGDDVASYIDGRENPSTESE